MQENPPAMQENPPAMQENPPAMQEMWVSSLSWEDPLEKGVAIHSSVLAREIPWTAAMGSQKRV